MPTLMALGKMLREGFDPSAPAEIYERKNAFVEGTEARSGFCLKQSLMSQGVFLHFSVMFTLVWSTYIHLYLKAILRAGNLINSP